MVDPSPRLQQMLPTGTVTFFLTDIEGSTVLWEQDPEAMRAALRRHDALFERAVGDRGGVHIGARGEGDSRFALFPSAAASVLAALELQRAFVCEPWPTRHPVKVRVGIHTGEVELLDGDYYGPAVNRCARIRGIGHGGQTLLSEATESLVRDTLPDGATLTDLGVHRLRGLTQPERVFQLGSADLPAAFPPLASADIRRHNLPTHRSPLIGREREIAEVRALLLRPDVGLVTLIGPGGTGKTRLATQVAVELASQLEDGSCFVALAPIRDPDLVAPTIGHELGVAMDGGRPPLETLTEHLRDRELLLVLDNLEQVVEAGPRLVELLTASKRLRLLVTSRVALRVSGEHEYDVPSLTLPPRAPSPAAADAVVALSQYEAIQLFVARAQAVRTDFTLTNANAREIAEICHRLDGLPLAIELAAARARLLPPSAMLARLAGPTGAPSLSLLTGGPRDQPARLQALRNTIAWSYDLLEPDEQALFRRLAIFVGGCTLDAVEEVARAVGVGGPMGGMIEGRVDGRTAHLSPLTPHPSPLDLVDSLLSKSLLRHVDGADGEPRYTMLETIREFGLESLALTGELSALRRWHAEHFLALAETAEPLMRGPEQARWLNRLEAEQDNLRAALEWSLTPDGDPQLALRLSGALAWFWYNRSHVEEARRWLAQALRQADDSSLARIKALAGAGRLAHIQHDSTHAGSLLHEALALAHDLNDRWWAAWVLHLLGRVSYFEGDAGTARLLGYRSLEIARAIQDEWLEAWALHLLGLAAHIEADHAQARRFYEESLASRRRIDFREGAGTILTLLGLIDFTEGDYAATRSYLRESLRLYRGLDAGWLMGNLVAQFLALAVAVGQADRAARLWGALSAMSEAVSIRPIPLIQAVLDPSLEAARQALGDVRFDAEQLVGRRMSEDEVADEALAIDVPAPGGPAAPARPPVAPTRLGLSLPDGLSAREAEVLRLIAAGATSKEIAEELVISIHTVEHHITHVYQKIGARGRAEATAYALRRGLA